VRQGERRRGGNLDTRGSKIVPSRSRLLDLPRAGSSRDTRPRRGRGVSGGVGGGWG